VGSEHFGLRSPGSAALAWGYHSLRLLRRLLEWFLSAVHLVEA